jgi:hypothetical protein
MARLFDFDGFNASQHIIATHPARLQRQSIATTPKGPREGGKLLFRHDATPSALSSPDLRCIAFA